MYDDLRKKALSNLSTELRLDCRFPKNVFRNGWDQFFFFDPEWIFEPQFVGRVGILLGEEGGSCACLTNLEEARAKGDLEQASLFLDGSMGTETYMSLIRGSSIGSGWLYQMDRYGCTSDANRWCIYCERNNEIAVLAVRENGVHDIFRSVIVQLNALPIDKAIENPPSYGLSQRVLPLEWRNKLLQAYAKSEH